MSERLTVQNFGPIRESDIDLRDLTVFVGPQATGKSLAAQSLFFLRRFETLLLQYADTPIKEAVLSALEWWFGKDFSVYVNSETRLCWIPESPTEETAHEIQWHERGIDVSPSLENRYSHPEPRPEAEVYIPAGRTLYSFLPPYALLKVDKCWFNENQKKVDYLFWGQSRSGNKIILLVELKGRDYGKALDQIQSMLHLLCKRSHTNLIHKGHHIHSPGHNPASKKNSGLCHT